MNSYISTSRPQRGKSLSTIFSRTGLYCLLFLCLLQSTIGRETVVIRIGNVNNLKKVDTFVFENYDFNKAKPFYRSLNTKFISAINKKTLESEILLSMPPLIRSRAVHYLEDILDYSQQHSLDPLWVLAIVWTESHFSSVASSSVSATGLMQIMPGTGVFLAELLKKSASSSAIKKMLVDPGLNIELGTFYLKRLLKRFRSHRYATVAYNMGPSFVRRNQRMGLPIGRRNIYYSKVKKYYSFLLRGVRRLEGQSRKDGRESILSYKYTQQSIRYYLGHDLVLKYLPLYAQR